MGVHVLKPTFTRGELTPLAHARPDIELYQQGARKISNWFVLKEGGLRRRSGTRYRGATKFSNKDTRFIPFKASATSQYVLEFGDGYVRFWNKNGQVTSGGSPYEIVSPYAEADLRSLMWAQSGNVLYIAFKSMTVPSKRLVFTSETSWAFSSVPFLDGPYLPINDIQNTATPSAAPVTGATSNVVFANTSNINNGLGFQSTDVGRWFRIQTNGNYSWGVISTVNSTTSIAVTWTEGNAGTTASLTWRLGAFSATTGYPGAVAIFQGRVFWANTPTNGRYYSFSYVNIPDTFAPSSKDGTVTDAHGSSGDIIAGDEIHWMVEAPRLQLGTASAIRSMGASDTDQSIGPRNITQKREMPDGVSSVRPVVVGPSTVHCGEFSNTIHDLYYDYDSNALVNPELSVTAEHLVRNGVTELELQSLPHRRLFAIANGQLLATTINKYEKIIGWTSQPIGGTPITMASIAGTRQHDLWLCVRRTINGSQVQYVETIDKDFLGGDLADAFFSDCGGTYSGAATNTVTGLTWLANTEVSILADGKVVPNQTVSAAGVLTLPNGKTASKIQYGLPIEAEVGLLRAPIQLGDGHSLGRRLKVMGIDIDLFETRGMKVVSDRGKTDTIRESPASNSGASGGLVTGSMRTIVDGSWTSEGAVSFLADLPLPATIRAINVHVSAEGN